MQLTINFPYDFVDEGPTLLVGVRLIGGEYIPSRAVVGSAGLGVLGASTQGEVAGALGLGTAAFDDAGDFDSAGAAAAVQSNLSAHTGQTGTAVHGLGSAASASTGDFDSAGAAAAVQSNLSTHTGQTGTAVHGLGSMSTVGDAASDGKTYARKNGAWAEVAASVSVYG